jgi:hypothetical protein
MFVFESRFLKESLSQYLKIGILLLSIPYESESIKSLGLFTWNPVRTDFEISSAAAVTRIKHVSQGISSPYEKAKNL